jgi:adenylate kinase
VEGTPTFTLFSLRGDPARAKIVVLGPASFDLPKPLRSLNIEHVSPTRLVRSGISRPASTELSLRPGHSACQTGSEKTLLAEMRRWFWARKPDAGFILMDFPATLLQAKVLDEWLEARGENLTTVLLNSTNDAHEGLTEYYRNLGLDLVEASDLSI